MNFKKIQFRRITSSGEYYPEIDGFRFVALFMIVILHIWALLITQDNSQYVDEFSLGIVNTMIRNGGYALPLFFILSGYILGLPFANHSLQNAPRVNLKKYFIRRLTRIEPPYFIAVALFFLLSVVILKEFSFNQGFKSLLASLTYQHNLIYGRQVLPLLLPPAWSLEVEVQFYVLAPVLALLYRIKHPVIRTSAFVATIVLLLFWDRRDLPVVSILTYLEHFLLGMLLAVLKVKEQSLLPKTKWDNLITTVAFFAIWLIAPSDYEEWYWRTFFEFVRLISAILFFNYIIFHKTYKFLSNRYITYLGAMSYSIYLLHYPIVMIVGAKLVQHQFSKFSYINVSIYVLILITLSLIASVIFYLLVERPCMDKNWYRKFVPGRFKLKA